MKDINKEITTEDLNDAEIEYASLPKDFHLFVVCWYNHRRLKETPSECVGCSASHVCNILDEILLDPECKLDLVTFNGQRCIDLNDKTITKLEQI